MTDRWDAAMGTEVAGPPNWDADPAEGLPKPAVLQGPPSSEGNITYGLVARASLPKPAYGFRVEHDLPPGVDFVDAKPKATVVGEHLIWQLHRVDPGQELRLEVTVKPHPETRFDPKDLADFTATYSQNLFLQAPIVKPRLTTRISGPTETRLGEAAEFVIDIVNTGNYVVENARTAVVLPRQFRHDAGPVFRLDLGDIPAGEYRRVVVIARADLAGPALLRAQVFGPADHQATIEFECVVVEG